LTLRVEGHLFARAENTDALYDAGGNVVRAGDAGSSPTKSGQEVDVVADYKLEPASRTCRRATAISLPATSFRHRGGRGHVDFAYASAQYTF
jgi:hypothetical protein